MKIDFTGQVALVTGGTRGLGKQIADDLFNLGADLILTGTSTEQIEELNHSLPPEKQRRIKYIAADFRDSENIERFTEQITAHGRIHVCVNNAGINRINYIDETLIEDWNDIITVNLKAPFMIIREVTKIMKERNYGRIINISSVFGVVSRPKRSAYSASKFGLRGLTLSVANELARYNILVNSVSPGFVLTELTKSVLTAEEMLELADDIPAGRLATPDEISRVVVFLASSLNTYIAGQNIIVDGGYVNV